MDATGTRTRNITMLVTQAGGPTAFGKLIGRDQVQVSQWTSATKPKAIGGRLARAIEKSLGYEAGWLDQPQWKPGEAAPEGRSTVVRLDADMLAETHAACRRWAERQGKTYSMEADPARFLQVYQARVKLSPRLSDDELMELGAVVQKIMAAPKGVGNGRTDGVPTTGTNGENVAGGGGGSKKA